MRPPKIRRSRVEAALNLFRVLTLCAFFSVLELPINSSCEIPLLDVCNYRIISLIVFVCAAVAKNQNQYLVFFSSLMGLGCPRYLHILRGLLFFTDGSCMSPVCITGLVRRRRRWGSRGTPTTKAAGRSSSRVRRPGTDRRSLGTGHAGRSRSHPRGEKRPAHCRCTAVSSLGYPFAHCC